MVLSVSPERRRGRDGRARGRVRVGVRGRESHLVAHETAHRRCGPRFVQRGRRRRGLVGHGL